MLNFYWPLPMTIGLTIFVVGIAVCLQNASRRANQTFLLVTTVSFLWAIANSMLILNWDRPELQVFWDRSTYAVGFLIAPTFALFSCYLPKSKLPPRWLTTSCFVISFGIVYLPFFTNTLEGQISEPHTANRIYLTFYSLCFSGFVMYGMRNLYVKLKAARNPLDRKQLKILWGSLLVVFPMGIVSGILIPLITPETWMLNILSVSVIFVFSVSAGYSMVRYGFMAPLPFALGQIFENFYGGIVVTDYDGNIVKSNQALARVLDLNRSIEGRRFEELAETLASRIEQSTEKEAFMAWFSRNQEGEREITLNGEARRVILVTKSTVRDAHKVSAGRIYTFLDATERKTLTRELQVSRDHLKALLENANDIIITCDITGKILSANKMAIEVSGLKPGEWQGRNIYDIIAPEFVEKTRQWTQEYLLGKRKSSVFQLEFMDSSGGRIPVETSLNAVWSNGEIVGVQAIARDLRLRLETERQIRELQALNEQVIRNAPVGIVTFDKDGFFTSVNPTYLHILGFGSPDGLLHRNFFDFETVKEFGHDRDLRKVLEGETIEDTYEFQSRITGKDVCVKAFSSPLLDEHGVIQGALLILADFSRQKELEKQLIQSEKLSSIGQLVSGVAHELNNPLTAIMGYSQLLSINKDLSEKTVDMAQKVQVSAERCKKIVENLLGFARRKPPEKCEVYINELLDRTIELREYDLRVSNIEVKRKYQTNLRSTTGDPDQLQQVFLNLLNNAFDAMRKANGEGVLEVRTHESGEDFINIEFVDNGPGVEESVQDKIFAPFFTTKPLGKGTGLGLSLSYGIMQVHGGSIGLDASYRGGAKFVVRIPIESVEPKSSCAFTPPEETEMSVARRILLIDDEEQILECTKILLENHSFQVTTAENGTKAKVMLDGRKFDVVITDMRMPGDLDGKALYHLILKEKPELAHKIIFITGDTLDAETESFLAKVPNRCVKKPFTGEELLNSIAAVTNG